MFARPNARHSQIAYVTNDLDAAIEMFKREFGAPGFFVFTNAQPGMAQSDGAQLRIALTLIGGVEIELIEPIGETAPLFSAVLPESAELVVRFHHVAQRIEGPIENWNAHVSALDASVHPVAWTGEQGDDLRYMYTDERATLGHYVEHVWFSPALLAQMQAAVPSFPPRAESAA